MEPKRPQNDQEQTVVSAERARQGEIILRTRWQRVIFIGGLAGIIILAIVWEILSR